MEYACVRTRDEPANQDQCVFAVLQGDVDDFFFWIEYFLKVMNTKMRGPNLQIKKRAGQYKRKSIGCVSDLLRLHKIYKCIGFCWKQKILMGTVHVNAQRHCSGMFCYFDFGYHFRCGDNGQHGDTCQTAGWMLTNLKLELSWQHHANTNKSTKQVVLLLSPT